MTTKTPNSVKRHHESAEPESCQMARMFKQQHFMLNSAHPIAF